MIRALKIIVEQHPDGYIAYPLGIQGVVLGEGDTYDKAVADPISATEFHIETFGPEVLDSDSPILEVFITEAGVTM